MKKPACSLNDRFANTRRTAGFSLPMDRCVWISRTMSACAVGRTTRLALNDKAVGAYQKLVDRSPEKIPYIQSLLNAHGSRAYTHESLGDYSKAVADWRKVLSLAEPSERVAHRFSLALAMARAGRSEEAVRETTLLLEDDAFKPALPDSYNLACLFALAANPQKPTTGSEASAQNARIQSAIDLLEQIEAKGFFKEQANQDLLINDPDLEALRGAQRFQKLLQRVKSAVNSN